MMRASCLHIRYGATETVAVIELLRISCKPTRSTGIEYFIVSKKNAQKPKRNTDASNTIPNPPVAL